MKLGRMLVFSVVVVSLTLVAIAAPDVKTFQLKFKGDGYFDIYPEDGDLVFTPRGGFDLLNVSHLGLSQVVWELRVDPEDYTFRNGTFAITGANGQDSLTGHYSHFALVADGYDLDWVFTGGTGRFEGATGTGHTDGVPDFDNNYAEFAFFGEITVPK